MGAMSSSPVPLRRALVPDEIRYPEELPITAWREELLDAIASHQVVIVAGETGSGKSTQLPKMCLELGRGLRKRIGHTQPRRIAARAIAERLADELATTVGQLVGYTVRFTDEVSESTAIKVMTDGILLNEIQRDRDLRRYDTIIVDEAHERSLNVDFLLGHLRGLIERRPDLKVIITSATIDTQRFSDHFADAPVIEVAGRTYPVDVRYRPLNDDSDDPRDQTTAICDAVTELASEGTGDILVFCSGEREIRDAVEALSDLGLRHTEILPLFGRLSAGEQHRVFSGHTGRRIVVATNVAETSLTVPGIRYVVDTGLARVSRFNRRTKVQQLPIEPISQASARQRAGRCGRLGPGICIRLYDEDDYLGRPEFTDPEILRTSLASVMLQMAAAELGAIETFPFIDAPDTRSIRDGIGLLTELGAVTDADEGTRSWLTPVGRKLSRIPIDPRLGRMLLAADANACLDEVLTIVSALAIQDPRERPLGKEEAADQAHRRFADATSDFSTYLHLWDHIVSARKELTANQFRRMCRNEFLNWRRVREWQDVRAQLRRVSRDMGMRPNRTPADPRLVHEALLTGLLSHVGRRDPDGWGYRGPRGTRFAIRPGSVLFKKAPEWIMAAELVETTRTWATCVAGVDPDTVARIGAHVVHRTVSDPWWDADRGAAVCRQTTSLYGITLSTDDVVPYAAIDPPGARTLFIEHALVAGEWDSDHEFVRRNAEAIEAVLEIETRERRSDLLVTDDVLAAWFGARVPEHVTGTVAFDHWWKDQRAERPDLLTLSKHDLIDAHAGDIDEEAFPRVWTYGDRDLELTYEFDPGSPTDGVTVDIPLDLLDLVDPSVLATNVPGLQLELITALIRSLAKHQRRVFAPVPDTAAAVAPEVIGASDPLEQSLARVLTQRSGVVIRPDDFQRDRLPGHLIPRYRIVRPDGSVVIEGGDLASLRATLRDAARTTVASTSHHLERTGETTWAFGDLPESVIVGEAPSSIRAYPGVVDDVDSVSVRLLPTAAERDEMSWNGVRRLVLLALPSPRRLLRSVLAADSPVSVVGSPYATVDDWLDDVLTCAVDAAMTRSGGVVLTSAGFSSLVESVGDDLAESVEEVGRAAASLLRSIHLLDLAKDDVPDAYGHVIDDIDIQLDRVLFDGSLTAVGAERIDDLARYVDAATYRLERITEDPERDMSRMTAVRALEDEFDDLTEVLAASPDLVEISWMLQELRVSLFAQPIGAKGPISEKRVRAALAALLE